MPATTLKQQHTPRRIGMPHEVGADCVGCGVHFPANYIVTDTRAEWCESEQCYAVCRRCYCAHCDHLMVWLERVDSDVCPIGVVVSGPALISQPSAVERFLREYSQVTGVTAQ